MINQDVILAQLSGALGEVSTLSVDQLSEDDKVRIAETIIGAQTQLGMLGEDVDPRVASQLSALVAVADKARII